MFLLVKMFTRATQQKITPFSVNYDASPANPCQCFFLDFYSSSVFFFLCNHFSFCRESCKTRNPNLFILVIQSNCVCAIILDQMFFKFAFLFHSHRSGWRTTILWFYQRCSRNVGHCRNRSGSRIRILLGQEATSSSTAFWSPTSDDCRGIKKEKLVKN